MPSVLKTTILKLSRFAGLEKLTRADYNSDMQKIDDEAARVAFELENMTIDCGGFEGNPVAVHNADNLAHPNMLAYGGTLEEHMTDPLAHEDIVLDGNAG